MAKTYNLRFMTLVTLIMVKVLQIISMMFQRKPVQAQPFMGVLRLKYQKEEGERVGLVLLSLEISSETGYDHGN